MFSRLAWLVAFFPALAPGQWDPALTDSTASFRGLFDAGRGTIWAAGTDGTVLRSEDEGYMWQQCTVPPGGAKLDFRGVFGRDADHAIVLSSGPGRASKLFATSDGCASWRLLFQNPDPEGFWDALIFQGQTGYLVGDPVDGKIVLYLSLDGGQHWERDASQGLTVPKDTAIFAASNSSLVAFPNGGVLIALGGVNGAKVLLKSSGKWASIPVPMAGGTDASGIFSVAFRDGVHGIAVGGDYKKPGVAKGTAAWTADGGQSWHEATEYPSGYRSAVGWDTKLRAWIAVGPNGSDLSKDDGRTWRRFDSAGWNTLNLPWAAGAAGRIASLNTAALGTN